MAPRQTINTTGGSVLTNAFDAVLAAPLNFDGSGTAAKVYLNWAIDDDNMNADVTNLVSGTVKFISTASFDK